MKLTHIQNLPLVFVLSIQNGFVISLDHTDVGDNVILVTL